MAYASQNNDGQIDLYDDEDGNNPIFVKLHPPAPDTSYSMPDYSFQGSEEPQPDPNGPPDDTLPPPATNKRAKGFDDVLQKYTVPGGGKGYNVPPSAQTPADPSPTLAAEGTNLDNEARLRAAGQDLPQKDEPSLFQNVMNFLGRSGAAGSQAVSAILRGEGPGTAASKFGSGLAGELPSTVNSGELATQVENANIPILSGAAKNLSQSGFGRFLEQGALGLATDPLSYIGVGEVGAAKRGVEGLIKGAEKFGAEDPALLRQLDLERQAADATESAARYDKMAKEGIPSQIAQIKPLGDMAAEAGKGADIIAADRARAVEEFQPKEALLKSRIRTPDENPTDVLRLQEGQVQEGRDIVTSRDAAEYAQAANADAATAGARVQSYEDMRNSWQSLSESAKAVAQATMAEAKAIAPHAFELAPDTASAYLKFAGVPIASVEPIKTALGAIITRVPGVTQIQDALGRIFVVNYTPTMIQGAERAEVIAGKNVLTQGAIQAANLRNRAMDEALQAPDALAAAKSGSATALRGNSLTEEQLGLKNIPADLRPEHEAAIRAGATAQAVAFNNAARTLRGMKGIVSEVERPGWRTAGNSIPGLEGLYLHPEIRYALSTIAPITLNSDAGIRTATQLYSSFLGAWKSVMLANPAFHVRNATGNIWLNIANGMVNPARYTQAVAVLLSRAEHSGLQMIELNGQKIPVAQLKEWASQFGILGTGAFHQQAAAFDLTQAGRRAVEAVDRAGFGNVAYHLMHPLHSSAEFGNFTDSVGRMANFIHQLDNGKSVADAANATRKALFDYASLTPAEQAIRANFVPFYAWLRNNLPKQVELMISSPGMFTGSAHMRDAAVNVNQIDERHLPGYLKDQQAIPLWVDGKGNIYYATLSLPYTDLSRVHDPMSLQDWFKEGVQALNPFYSTVGQVAANVQVMTGNPITRTPTVKDKALEDYGNFLLSQLAGAPGRFVAGNNIQTARDQAAALKLAEGKTPDVAPVPHAFPGLPYTITNPANNARSDTFHYRTQLEETIAADQARGVTIPSKSELDAKNAAKGFGAALSKEGPASPTALSTSGGGFAAALGAPKIAAPNVPQAVTTAIKDSGVDATWGPYLATLMQRESTGRPDAVNNTPVLNTWTTPGKPFYEHAQGLFQMLPSTFKANAVPGHTDILSAYDNTLAAIRYIQGMYGHPSLIKNLTNYAKGAYAGY